MLPTLLQIGPLAISSQGFFLVLAFLTASFIIWRRGTEENFEPEVLMDATILTTIIALVWSRIFFVVFSASGTSWERIFNFFKFPGFSYFGAFLGGVGFLAIWAAKKKWDFFRLVDVFVFGLVAGQILIRIGNFLDGSFGGKPTRLFWGLKLPGSEQVVHPLALYEIIFLVFLLVLIKKLERQYRLFDWYKDKRGEAAEGFLFLTYLLFYSVFRFLLEFLAVSSLYFKGLGWEQWLVLVTGATSLVLFYSRSGRKLGDFFAPVFKKWQKFKNKKRGEKMEILVPRMETKRVIIKKPFHFKVGVDAKSK